MIKKTGLYHKIDNSSLIDILIIGRQD